MNENEIRNLSQGIKVLDNRSGEELIYLSFPGDSKYVICLDCNNTSVWLTPDRIEGTI